jgi:hypothetical protein
MSTRRKEENRLALANATSFRLREVEAMPVMSQEEICPIIKQYFDFLEKSLSGQHDSVDIGLLQEMLLEISLLLRSGKGRIREDGYLRLLNRLTSIYAKGLRTTNSHAFTRTASHFADIIESVSQQFQNYDYSHSVSLLLHYMDKLFNAREESWLEVYEYLLNMPESINVMKQLRDEHIDVINTWIEEGVDNLFTLREEQLDMIDIQTHALQDLDLQVATRQSQLDNMPSQALVVEIDRARQLREVNRLYKQREQLVLDRDNKHEIVELLDTNIKEFTDRLAQMRRSTLIKLA